LPTLARVVRIRDPDGPCECGSGIRYADCHQGIVDAPKGKKNGVGQRLYAQNWASNAQSYQSQGLYSALAKELVAAGGVCRVLDIGCGLGHGLQALMAEIPTDRLIIGIDENPECLSEAANRLGLPRNDVSLNRLTNKELLSGAYDIQVRRGPQSYPNTTARQRDPS
jgi:protein-L-isoaspartate O-methyltransferase